jgi:hypothetical protein
MQAQKARGAVRCTITALAVQEERVTASAAKLGITINMYAVFFAGCWSALSQVSLQFNQRRRAARCPWRRPAARDLCGLEQVGQLGRVLHEVRLQCGAGWHLREADAWRQGPSDGAAAAERRQVEGAGIQAGSRGQDLHRYEEPGPVDLSRGAFACVVVFCR